MDTGLIFVLSLIILAVLVFYLAKRKYSDINKKVLILFMGVFLFEIMAEPMWINKNLPSWTYIYGNVSWLLTIGWTAIFMLSFLIGDWLFKKMSEKKKFWIYLLIVTLITTPIEVFMIRSGIRSYDISLTQTFSGITIPLTNVPLEIMLAVPLIAALVIPFYKYLSKTK